MTNKRKEKMIFLFIVWKCRKKARKWRKNLAQLDFGDSLLSWTYLYWQSMFGYWKRTILCSVFISLNLPPQNNHSDQEDDAWLHTIFTNWQYYWQNISNLHTSTCHKSWT